MIRFNKMDLEHLNSAWNDVAVKFPQFKVYHSQEWLDFLRETQELSPILYAITRNDEPVGWLPGFLIQKGPIKIFASPFEGWTTPYMGLLIHEDVAETMVLKALHAHFREERFHFAQFSYLEMDREAARDAGFLIEASSTYIAQLSATPEEQLTQFSKSTRKHVRRAMRRGLVAETTEDRSFIDVYYSQLEQVFAKRRMRPTYSRERVEALWTRLTPTGNLIATQVWNENSIIATRLDIVHGVWMHSFGSASDQAHLGLYPNELARFHAVSEAIKRGARMYDMSGGGSYKAKFGAQETGIPRAVFDPYRLRTIKEVARRVMRARFRLGRLPLL